MSTLQLNSKFAAECKTDAGWLAFLSIMLGVNVIIQLVKPDLVWWEYVFYGFGLLICISFASRALRRFFVIGLLVEGLKQRGQ